MRHIFLLGLAWVLMLAPVMAAGQADDELELFESEDGLFSVRLPEGWVAAQNEDEGGFVIASSEELIPFATEDDIPPLEADQIIIILSPLPEEIMFFFGIEDAEAPLEEMAVLVVQSLFYDYLEPEIELEVDIFTHVAGELAWINLALLAENLPEESQAEVAMSLVTADGGFIVGIVVTGEGGLATYSGLIAEIIASFEFDNEMYYEMNR